MRAKRNRLPSLQGKLTWSKVPREVRALWNNRHVEPDLCEPIDTYIEVCSGPELVINKDLVKRLMEIAPLNTDQKWVVSLRFLDGCTFREASKEMGRCEQRVREIAKAALVKLRQCEKDLTEIRDLGDYPDWYETIFRERRQREMQ